MTPLPRRLRARQALLFVWVAGLGACDTSPAPLPPPNAPPTLRIHQPMGNTPVRAGEPVALEAMVEDAEDGATLDERVLWVSSVSGQLARGAHVSGTFREAGPHTVTATVVDSGGQSASASVTVVVLAEKAPRVTVLEPAPGGAFNLGEALDLECEALTVDGARLTGGAVQWTSVLSGRLPSGDKVKAALTVAGEDTLTCLATDPETGASTSASVRLTVRPTRAPAVLITRPELPEVYVKDGEPVPASTTVLFRATAQDFDAAGGPGNLDAAIQWTVEPGGLVLGTGPSVTHTFTAPGTYTVTVRAVDGRGNAAMDSVRVRQVTNLPPRCAIASPRDDNARLEVGAETALEGRCVDPETGEDVEPTWATSASPQPLGTGFDLDARLDVTGAQALSACAVDPEDASLRGCAERPVYVIVDTAPTGCAIQSPQADAPLNAGTPLALEGSATDSEDPRGDLRFAWTSSRDGALARGPSATTRQLSTAGTHTLTLTVTDPAGRTCSASVDVEVNGAPDVKVTGVRQGDADCLESPCREGEDVIATGTAKDSDTPGALAELAWLDSLAGTVGSSASATLPRATTGKHTLVLRATDRDSASGRAAASFTVLPGGRTQLVETAQDTGKPVTGLALSADGLRYVDGATPSVFRAQPPPGTLAVGAPARALFRLTGTGGDVLFVGTEDGVARCVGTECARFGGGPLALAGRRVTAVVALASPDLLLLGTEEGLVLTRASNPSADGHPGTVVGRRALEGFAVRQVVLSPSSSASLVKAWAATADGLAEVTVRVEEPFEPALATVTTVLHVPPEVPDDDVLSVAVGPEASQVFVGTRRGFGVLCQEGPALKAAPWNLPDETVQALLFERRQVGGTLRDVLWAGTRNGLLRYDVSGDIVTPFGTKDGLLDADVRVLLPGPDGIRYIGTARGISRYAGN